MEKRWTIVASDAVKTEALQAALNINKTICSILVARGIETFEIAKDFYRPKLSDLHDPWLMKDMDKAVARILTARAANERILVFGDYDVDGTTAVASMYQFIGGIHNNTDYYIPHRYKEGYGVSKMGIDYAKETGCTLIISLDCGIKSTDLIAYAKTLGIDFIVCDHHLPDPIIPPAVAILNPKQIDCPYPYKELCGCGVGIKLMMALAQKLQLPDDSYLTYLDLAATAIAADIVPLTGENRILAYYGLEKVNQHPCPGIKALLQLSKVEKKMVLNNLVFVIAPRINAAGRMDDAKKAVQLFIEQDATKALEFAQMLQSDNLDRREADSTITEDALAQIINDPSHAGKKTTFVYEEHWHKGVVGIVASRLIETYYRPTIVLTRSGDIAAGSARSVVGFNLYEAIHACRQYLIGYGGHFAAAGMTHDLLFPEIVIDAPISFKEINQGFYNILSQMEPFGPENMRPVFIARGVNNTPYSKIVKDQHIRFVLKQDGITLSGIGFKMADKFALLQMNQPLDIVFTLDENEWNNEKTIQLKMIDLRLSA